jgi:protein tyrosine/serine phosphatase
MQGEVMTRPAHWAQPIVLGGVPNMFKVDDGLYRSAQPTREGMRSLQRLGIATIVNLRWLHSDRGLIKGTTLGYQTCRAKAWHIEDEDVVWFLDAVSDPIFAPFLVHCQHGSDRTGCMIAMYRIVVQGWPKGEAIRELECGGYGYHTIWQNIPKYLKDVDVGKIRSELSKKGGSK